MRVLFVNSHLDKGGGQAIQTLQLFRSLRPCLEAEYLVLGGTGPHQELLREPGVRQVGSFRYPQGIRSLQKAIRDARGTFDLVHVNDVYFGLPATYLARAHPRVVLFGTDPVQEIGWRYGRAASRVIRAALPTLMSDATLVTNSEPLADTYRRYAPIVIPNGIDLQRFSHLPSREEARRQFGWGPSERVVLFVGKVLPVKRVEWLLEAIRAVPEGRLVIVGGFTEQFYGDTYHRELVREYPEVQPRTNFVGEVAPGQIDAFLAAADVFAFPSRFEGMPNAVMEAMAAGLPIVASDIPAHRALLQPGRTGLLVRTGAEMGQTLAALFGDDTRRKELGDSARSYVQQNFALEVVRDRYLELYRTVLHEGT